MIFDPAARERVSDWLVERARADDRIVAGAAIGSLTAGGGDRYSDLDLTFAIREDGDLEELLDDYAQALADEFDATMLFDLPWKGIVYRVFLFPDCLQLDLSFSRGAVVQTSPKLTLLWGEARQEPSQPQPAEELFGWAALLVRSARVTIERGQPWLAEWCVTEVRNNAMGLACRRRGLPVRYAKGRDQLPEEVRRRFAAGIVRSLERDELERALAVVVECLLDEAEEVREIADAVAAPLREAAAGG